MCMLVTIVTPSYNQGKFIRATIESVLTQDYPEIEYIIMDGGSTDETAQVVAEYAGRLTWISEKDRGQSHAINKGFRMAKGEIVAWLNSDDILLPGAVTHAVNAFRKSPKAGAIYGEGYLIDYDGNVTSRFPVTEKFNLWKLVYVSDYILQQTVFFRKAVLEEIDYVDESLHWGMDWDVLIRIGKRYKLVYIPEYMGCLREYAEAKTSSGGPRRFRELAQILRRHGSMRYPPGYIIYGLDTYIRVWRDWIGRWVPTAFLKTKLQQVVNLVCGKVIERTIRECQGWYSDGWASETVRLMLPPGSGQIKIHGMLPDMGAHLNEQTVVVFCEGEMVHSERLSCGDFCIEFPLQQQPSSVVNLTLVASRTCTPAEIGESTDRRRLAYLLKDVDWAD